MLIICKFFQAQVSPLTPLQVVEQARGKLVAVVKQNTFQQLLALLIKKSLIWVFLVALQAYAEAVHYL